MVALVFVALLPFVAKADIPQAAGWEGWRRLRTTRLGVNQPASHQGCRDRQPRKATYRPRHFQGPRLDLTAAGGRRQLWHGGPRGPTGRTAGRRKRPPGSAVPAGAPCRAPSLCHGPHYALSGRRLCSGWVCIKAPSTCPPSEQLQSTPLSHRAKQVPY